MKRFVIWPQYLECSLTRRLGRRVPKGLCVDGVTVEDILHACERLLLKCEVEEDKRYPRAWYLTRGRVLIEYNGSKNSLLKILATEIRKLRCTGTK